MKRPELLIPAGNLEKLRTAILYGADAVYVGVEGLSLRASQAEINPEDLETGVREAHQKGVKVYAAINVFAKNRDLELVGKTIRNLVEIGIDGVILSDPGVLNIVKKVAPNLAIHLSTQANTTNVEAVRFWSEQGVKRVVLARELSLTEISEFSNAIPGVQLELFVHGAMCVAYSGRCFLSALQTGRSSNQGECTQPCRWEYFLYESSRPNEPITLQEDWRYSYLLSSKDLCMIEYLAEIVASGITSLKVEGRMKSAYYVAVVTRSYRWAIDALMKEPTGYKCKPEWLNELAKISNRGYTTGFYFADRVNETSPEVKYMQTYDLVGTVLDYDPLAKTALLGVRNQLLSSDQIELLLPDVSINLDPTKMTDPEGFPVQAAHNGYRVRLPVDRVVPPGAVVRKKL